MIHRRTARWVVAGGFWAVVGLALLWPETRTPSNPFDRCFSVSKDHSAGNEQRQLAKGRIDLDLAKGRLSLREAIHRCLELDQQYPHLAAVYRPAVEKFYAGDTYTERLARNLLAVSEAIANEHPDATAIRSRLEAEFAEMFPNS